MAVDTDGGRIPLAYAAGLSAAVGLGVGISGIVVLLRQSEAENTALAHYQRPPVPAAIASTRAHRTAAVVFLVVLNRQIACCLARADSFNWRHGCSAAGCFSGRDCLD